MTKLLKIVGNTLFVFTEVTFLLVILFSFFIRTSSFQTYLAQKGTIFLSEYLNTKVEIGKVDIVFLDRLYFDELYVQDEHKDTLFYIQEFYLHFNLRQAFQLKFEAKKVKITNAKTYLKKYKNEEVLNLQFIVDAFKNKDKERTETDFQLRIDEVEIQNSYFAFVNQNKEKRPFGIDFSDLYLQKIHLYAQDVVIRPKSYEADFEKLNFQDKSGFHLENLSAQAKFDEKGLKMNQTKIKTQHSNLYLNVFNLAVNNIKDFSNFLETVQVQSEISPSSVSLTDVSYFAPNLKGMNDIIEISGASENTISDLALKNIQLKYGTNTVVEGNFSLPDFKQMSAENINQKIDYLALNINDLENFTLPETAKNRHIKVPKSLQAISVVEGYDLTVSGKLDDLTLKLAQLNTSVGNFTFDDEFRIVADTAFSNIKISPKNGVNNHINIKNLNLAKLTGSNEIGNIRGRLGIRNLSVTENKIQIQHITGILNQTKLLDYSYDYIIFDDFNYTLNRKNNQHSTNGNLFVRDENLDLSFAGTADFGNNTRLNAAISLECANLDAINTFFEGRGELIANLNVDMSGKSMNDFAGNLIIDSLIYEENGEIFKTHDFNSFIVRSPLHDSITIQSDIVEGFIGGKFDYQKMFGNISNQVAGIFPMFIQRNENIEDKSSHFKYDITFKEVNNLLSVIYPSFEISNLANLSGSYSGDENELRMKIDADYFSVGDVKFNEILSRQTVSDNQLTLLMNIDGFSIRDSSAYKGIHLTGLASNGKMDAQIQFLDTKDNLSNIEWLTNLNTDYGLDITIYPSTISFFGNNWLLKNNAFVSYQKDCLIIEDFKLENNNQYFIADGAVSESPLDRLYLDIMNMDLKNIGAIIDPGTTFSGIADITGYATSPMTNFQFNGEAIIEDFYINETEVGNIGFGAYYSAKEENVKMTGELFYHDIRTFHFDGFYDLNRDNEMGNIDFKMHFKQTDIAAVNEFLDPNFIKNLQGKIDGKLNLTGTLKKPVLSGKAKIIDGIFNMAFLGSDLYIDGEVEATKDSIIINRLPIKDVEGNTGFVNGVISHKNFNDFFYDFAVNLQEHPTKKMPNDPSKPLPLERFLIMNTVYDVDNPYYGEAYITGSAQIKGASNDLSINVVAKTQKGTKFALPLFGPTTIEEDGFITFKKLDEESENTKNLNLTGVDFKMEIDATDNAEVKLIFDEKIGDEITASGNGLLNLSVDRFGELAMEGTYTVSKGVYNFTMGPYKQIFNISPGSTVQWSGNPYEANLNINAFYKTMANLSTVMPDVVENQSSNNEEIHSYLNIRGNMKSPEISFDLDAPKANESGKAIISRIKSDQDELNRQFFSIIISKSFMPLSGVGVTGQTSGAFLDLASTQLSNLLNKMADGYNMNVNLENDDFSGQFSGEFGLSKSFLDDRLFISGSFGVGTRRTDVNGSQGNIPSQNTFIGDVKIEYLLNDKGTFRMNVFNESNNNYLLKSEGRGQFTQGVGVSYNEDFHNFEDFKLYHFFANVFRRKENKVKLRNERNKEVPIPEEFLNKSIKNEE